jgi:arginase
MTDVELIGIPFDGYGRPGNQALASRVLRDNGLAECFAGHRVIDGGDLELPAPAPERGAATTLINEPALLAMIDALSERVGRAVLAQRFPVVFGGDCSSLLGTVCGLRDRLGGIGLVFIDGHEDTMPLDVSEDGEAANTEIGLLLGLTGRLLTGPLASRLPALEHSGLAVLGPRDEGWRRQFNVGSLRDHGVWLRSAHEVASDPARTAAEAVRHVRADGDRWWLHVDLDVLDPLEFRAQGLPGVDDEPGGLTLRELSEVLVAAIGAGACVGWSIAIYDPDQDPDRTDAARILRLLSDVAATL